MYSTAENLKNHSLVKQASLSRFAKPGATMPPSEHQQHQQLQQQQTETFPSTPGKIKMERSHYFHRVAHRWQTSASRLLFWIFILFSLFLLAAFFFSSSSPPIQTLDHSLEQNHHQQQHGGAMWEKKIRQSARPKHDDGLVVLVTGAAGFVGMHVSTALKKRGDGVLGLDNFNPYYDPALKRAREAELRKHNVFIVEGDINDGALLRKLFAVITFTHVMHLAAQAGVRYAMENPASYVHSNVAGLVSLLEACKEANPQPAVVWASSSSVYGLNSKVPFSESDRTDQPASLYAATKKAGEAIAHTYNHIYGLSITGLRFFTVYGPWGRPDMAYYSFTKAIVEGKVVSVYEGVKGAELARDFTYVDDVVSGCLGAVDTTGRSTGSGGKKRGAAKLRVYNLGNTVPVTVGGMVDVLERHLKIKARRKVVRMPRNGDVAYTHANVTLARVELGYEPTTDLSTGLRKFVKWYMQNRVKRRTQQS